MRTIKVIATRDLISNLFETGNVINARVLEGIPDDATLIDSRVDNERAEITFLFNTNDKSVDDEVTVQWQKDNRMACIEQEIERQTLKELCITPMALIQTISDIVEDNSSVEAKA